MSAHNELDRLHAAGMLTPLDVHFARFMAGLAGDDSPELLLAAALVSNRTGAGHICLDLSTCESWVGEASASLPDEPVLTPKLSTWTKKLKASLVVGKPGDFKPLILDTDSNLYLYRYWEYEKDLADIIRAYAVSDVDTLNEKLLKQGLARLFPGKPGKEPDWQRVAAAVAVMKKFCVISGGPGTGKTTTVAAILALLLEQAAGEPLRIALAAPTGKAAARMQEAVKAAKASLQCAAGIKEAIPDEASTIHRLLGYIPDSSTFRYNESNPLPADVVVVDEASMVDMALMCKLARAVFPHGRLILLGDKDQLASVEAGKVLGDICNTGMADINAFSPAFVKKMKTVSSDKLEAAKPAKTTSPVLDCVVQLQKNYRFSEGSGIHAVSIAVRDGDGARAVELLRSGTFDDMKWSDLPQPKDLAAELKARIVEGYGPYLNAFDPVEKFNLLGRLRILCAIRQGPYGIHALNDLVETVLEQEGLIEPDRIHYEGRPIMVTRNDYNLRLFNGDVGIILPDPEANNDLRAFFQAPDGTLRRLLPLRLPEHETVYAMTVHKSQGSEFERVLFILPDKLFPLLTRELVYTAITRPKTAMEVMATEEVFHAAVEKRIERTSGLRQALWGDK
ncbi:MAG: exodeoxyribonuclease V subunit alpha [Pseudomonadota bacterium]